MVLNEVGRILANAQWTDDAVAVYERAEASARASQRSDQIYKALRSIGCCYFDAGRPAEALRYFQASIAFANFIWPSDLVNTLEMVARCWQQDGRTVQAALAMYEWILRLRPESLDMRVARYRMMLLNQMDADVARECLVESRTTDIESLADAVAANAAIGNNRKANRNAREARRIAEERSDVVWQQTFERFLA